MTSPPLTRAPATGVPRSSTTRTLGRETRFEPDVDPLNGLASSRDEKCEIGGVVFGLM